IIAGIVPGSAFNLVTHNQEFIVAVVTPRNTDTPSRPEVFERIDMRHVDFDTMTSHILRSIGEAGITGQYQVVDLYRAGHGHPVLGIVVFSEPVATPIDLPEPRGTDVIYVQGHAGWKTIPSEVRPVNRHIQISPPYPEDNNNWLASMMIYDVTGVGTGFAVPNPTANRTHTH